EILEVVEREDCLFTLWKSLYERGDVIVEGLLVDLFEVVLRILVGKRLQERLLSFAAGRFMQGEGVAALRVAQEGVVLRERHVQVLGNILIFGLAAEHLPERLDRRLRFGEHAPALSR